MSYINYDDLNRVFTPEGREEAMQRAYETPSDWQGGAVVAPVADPTQQVQSPAAPTNDQQPTQPEQPGGYPQDPRFEQARQMLQGVFAENQSLRQTQEQIAAQQASAEEAAFQARLRALQEAGDHDRAVAEVQQRAAQREANLIAIAQQQIAAANAQAHNALVTGFTSEIIREHPRLTDEERALLETISVETPDDRSRWAAYFESQHEAREQMARQQGATIHAASGAGLVGGVAPPGGAQTAPSGPQSSYEILRNTPWQTTQG